MVIGVVAVFGSFGPVIAISALPGNLTQTFAAGDRVLDLLAEKPAVTPVTNGTTSNFEDLAVQQLSFSYNAETPVLRDIDLHAKKGEIIGIVGESGCGKSTFLKLLLRFWQKNSGAIRFGGVDVDNIDTAALLKNVTMVSQTTYLFDETIEENLRIAKPDATQEELEAAYQQCGQHQRGHYPESAAGAKGQKEHPACVAPRIHHGDRRPHLSRKGRQNVRNLMRVL